MIDTPTLAILGVQAAVILVWGGAMTSRVKQLEKDVLPIADLRQDMATLTERMDHLIRLLEPVDPPPRRRGRADG